MKGSLPLSAQQGVKAEAISGIESASQNQHSDSGMIMDRLALPGQHWQLRNVRFKDVTDKHDNLLQEDRHLLYNNDLLLQGNLLLAQYTKTDEQLIFLKLAPLAEHQQAYPGYDFMLRPGDWRVSGPGLSAAMLSEDKWTPGYSLAWGISEQGKETAALQRFLRKQRPFRVERDAMIMMNTWGDRGRDGKLNEKFVINELEKADRLGITHFQIDDGWQAGLSKNSASAAGELWDAWPKESWLPHPERFPDGLEPVVKAARKRNMQIGLWFHPSNAGNYAQWEQDAEVLIELYRQYGVRYFKIDGIELPNKQSEENLRKMFDRVREASQGEVVFNLDATAGVRGGYFLFNEYGNIFLENRYTDWGNYYPYRSLRNLWMLAHYMPPQNLQLEFLNKWRNTERYPDDDPFAPSNYSFDYIFATTMAAQPLAWMEASNLPEEAFVTAELIKLYKEQMADWQRGVILPIGEEPSGASWTGFQSFSSEDEGYLLVFREDHNQADYAVPTFLEAHTTYQLTPLYGPGRKVTLSTDNTRHLRLSIPEPNSFVLLKYKKI
ncbi:MAG: alpha-galactosidase [Cyclobacteriaceae bacterium]